MLAERCITRDDGLSDPEPWHLIGDDFFGVRQRAGKLSAQSNQRRAEVFRSFSYIGVVISKHRQSRLPLASRSRQDPHHLSFNQLDDWIKLIRRKVQNGSNAVAAVKLIEP